MAKKKDESQPKKKGGRPSYAKGLSDRQRRFAEEYIKDLNGTQAALRAGYSPTNARKTQWVMLANELVQGEIQRLMQARSQRTQITTDRVLEEFAKIGFANMGDYIRVHQGDPFVDLSRVAGDPSKLAAISEASSEDYLEGRCEDARQVRKVKIKLHDKIAALTQIGRHLGMFNDRVTIKHDLSALSDEDLEALERIQGKLNGGGQPSES